MPNRGYSLLFVYYINFTRKPHFLILMSSSPEQRPPLADRILSLLSPSTSQQRFFLFQSDSFLPPLSCPKESSLNGRQSVPTGVANSSSNCTVANRDCPAVQGLPGVLHVYSVHTVSIQCPYSVYRVSIQCPPISHY